MQIHVLRISFYNQQKWSSGQKGCPKLRANTTVLVPVDIKTNITVPAHDLPVAKVLLEFFYGLNKNKPA